jgi:hypothetical protein
MTEDITIDEFFAIRSLLNGSIEDFQIGKSNLNNLEYNNKEIVITLFIKSLSHGKRIRFIESNDKNGDYSSDGLIGKSIYKTIKQKADKKIYKQILLKIMKT